MSYLVFGNILYEMQNNMKTLDDIAWNILRKSVDLGIYIIFYPNLPQQIVNTMLDEQSCIGSKELRFMILSSPLCDTSDSLISPSHFGDNDFFNVKKICV